MQKQKTNKQAGFTLIELLVVVIVFGSLMFSMTLLSGRQHDKSDQKSKSRLETVAKIVQTLKSENGGSFKGITAIKIAAKNKDFHPELGVVIDPSSLGLFSDADRKSIWLYALKEDGEIDPSKFEAEDNGLVVCNENNQKIHCLKMDKESTSFSQSEKFTQAIQQQAFSQK